MEIPLNDNPHEPVDEKTVIQDDSALPVHVPADDPPKDKMEDDPAQGFYELDPDYIRAERMAGLIFSGVLAISAVIALVAKFLHNGFDWIWFLILGSSALVLFWSFWTAIFWPRISYRRIRWKLDEVGLEIHRGVVWRHRISVPFARVQHADVSQGPIQRYYALGTLTVHTAGTANASVDLPGLNHGIATGLRDRLVRQRKADADGAA